MDIMLGTTIINPSGLDASAVGSPSLVRGVSARAVELDTPTQYVKVSGPGHRYECFGDLDLCNLGKSVVPMMKLRNVSKISDDVPKALKDPRDWGGGGGSLGTRATLLVQFLSFLCKIIVWRTFLWSWRTPWAPNNCFGHFYPVNCMTMKKLDGD